MVFGAAFRGSIMENSMRLIAIGVAAPLAGAAFNRGTDRETGTDIGCIDPHRRQLRSFPDEGSTHGAKPTLAFHAAGFPLRT